MTRFVMLAGLAVLTVVFLAGCSTGRTYPFISLAALETQPSQPAPGEGRVLRVALASITSAKESIVYYEQLLKYLSEKTGLPVKIVQRKTYAEVNELMRVGEVDMAFVCTYSYVRGDQESSMELLAVPRVKGQTTYQSALIVRKDSGIENFQQLQGKSFAFTDPQSTTGTLYPIFLVKQQGYAHDKYFSRTTFTFSHDNSIRAVADGLVDGAAVDSLVLDYAVANNHEYAEKVKVIQLSPPYGIPPVVVRPELDPGLKRQLRQTMMAMDQDPWGNSILAELRIEKFVIANDADYNGVRELAEAVRGERTVLAQ